MSFVALTTVCKTVSKRSETVALHSRNENEKSTVIINLSFYILFFPFRSPSPPFEPCEVVPFHKNDLPWCGVPRHPRLHQTTHIPPLMYALYIFILLLSFQSNPVQIATGLILLFTRAATLYHTSFQNHQELLYFNEGLRGT